MKLKTFDILHCHNPFVWYKPWRYLSAAIRMFETLRFGRYSWAGHTAIIVVKDGETWVYEADPKVKKTKYSEWARDIHVSVTRFNDNTLRNLDVEDEDVFKYCEKTLGIKYDFLGLILWQPIYIITGKWFGKKNNGKFYCSEYVADICNHFIGTYNNKDEINPSKLYCDMVNMEIYKGKASYLTE